MTAARIRVAALVAAVTGLLAWAGLDAWTGGGGTRPPLSWTTVVGPLALAAAVVAAGLPVRRWVRGRGGTSTPTGMSGRPGRGGASRPGRDVRTTGRGVPTRPLNPLVAARTAVLAKAAAYGGAVLIGWFAAQAVLLLPDLVGVRRRDLVVALLAVASSVLLVVAGFVVQSWCRVPPDDDDPAGADRNHLEGDRS